jgi:hypothetical protein
VPFFMSAVLLRKMCPQIACILNATIWICRPYYSSGFIVMCKICEYFIKSAIYLQYWFGNSCWKLLGKVCWKIWWHRMYSGSRISWGRNENSRCTGV